MPLSDEEIADIADRAVKSTMKNMDKHKAQAAKSNRRNALLADSLVLMVWTPSISFVTFSFI